MPYRAQKTLFFLSFFLLGMTSPPSLKQKIKDAASRASLDPALVEAVVKVESNFRTQATSKKGAMGLMQVIRSTAEACEIHEPSTLR